MCHNSNPITLSTIPNLCFLPVENLYLHEHFDNTRHRPLAQRIEQEGVLRNPPIVVKMNADGSKFLVLDGANRVTALKHLGILDIPVQVVKLKDPGIRVGAWNHVVWNISPQDLLLRMLKIPDIRMHQCKKDESPSIIHGDHLILVSLDMENDYAVSSVEFNRSQRVNMLNAVVDSYKNCASIDRTTIQDVQFLNGDYPDLGGLILFPTIPIAEIIKIRNKGALLPSGITRFIISPRVTRINYPISELYRRKSLTEKNDQLHEWMRERLNQKQVRFYPEATLVFDE